MGERRVFSASPPMHASRRRRFSLGVDDSRRSCVHACTSARARHGQPGQAGPRTCWPARARVPSPRQAGPLRVPQPQMLRPKSPTTPFSVINSFRSGALALNSPKIPQTCIPLDSNYCVPLNKVLIK
jgi:hypothetical protein